MLKLNLFFNIWSQIVVKIQGHKITTEKTPRTIVDKITKKSFMSEQFLIQNYFAEH